MYRSLARASRTKDFFVPIMLLRTIVVYKKEANKSTESGPVPLVSPHGGSPHISDSGAHARTHTQHTHDVFVRNDEPHQNQQHSTGHTGQKGGSTAAPQQVI